MIQKAVNAGVPMEQATAFIDFKSMPFEDDQIFYQVVNDPNYVNTLLYR